MAETTADVRRDIELTRERMSTTLQQLERKLNLMQVVRENPWPSLALAVGAGILLSGSRTDVKAAAATVAATKGASSKVGTVLDDVVSNLVGGLHEAFETRVTSLVNELKTAIGAPVQQQGSQVPADVTPARATTSAGFDRAMARPENDGSVGVQSTRAD